MGPHALQGQELRLALAWRTVETQEMLGSWLKVDKSEKNGPLNSVMVCAESAPCSHGTAGLGGQIRPAAPCPSPQGLQGPSGDPGALEEVRLVFLGGCVRDSGILEANGHGCPGGQVFSGHAPWVWKSLRPLRAQSREARGQGLMFDGDGVSVWGDGKFQRQTVGMGAQQCESA